jgi:hypothetical protein
LCVTVVSTAGAASVLTATAVGGAEVVDGISSARGVTGASATDSEGDSHPGMGRF